MDLLKQPIKEKELSNNENDILRYGSCGMQGWRRRMEDSHISDLSQGEDGRFNIFGVFDGHGGKEVSTFVKNHFTKSFLSNKKIKTDHIKQAIIETFLNMDELMQQSDGKKELKILAKKSQEEDEIFAKKYNIKDSQMDIYIKTLLSKDDNIAFSRGCTACVCVIDNKTKKIFFANAGDSRVILCKNGKAFRMSIDHKPVLEIENNRIHKASGWVNSYGRINGNLNLSRCIGDLEYKQNKKLKPQEQIISAYPDVIEEKMEKDNELIIIGCDGIWDCIEDQDLCDNINEKIKKSGVETLKVNLANILGEICDNICAKDILGEGGIGCDNMTCLVIQFK